MYWPVDFDPDRTGAFNAKPARGEFGISDARIVSAGRPGHSTVLYRMLITGNGRMPAIGSREVDEAGALLLRQWIASLPSQADDENVPESLDDTASAIDQALDAITMSHSQRSDLVAAAMHSLNPATRDLFQRFLPPGQRRRALGSGFDPAVVLALTGDQERGRDLFHSPTGPQCSTCHQVEGKGRALGPDLSAIGARYSRDQLLHHITKPNASIEQQWHLHLITVGENDEPHTGFIITSDVKNLRLLNTLGAEVEIATDQVTSNVELPTSLMPEGTLDTLTAQEAADLLAFLLR